MNQNNNIKSSKISEASLRFLEGSETNMPRQIRGKLESILAKFEARFSFERASAEAAALVQMSGLQRLSIRDEVVLAQRWLDEGDEEALEGLVLSYLPLLFRICVKDRNFGDDYLDVLHDAVVEMLGILHRMDEFDVDRFSSNVGFRVLESRVRRIAKMARPMSGPSGVLKVRCITHLARHDLDLVDDWDVRRAAIRSGLPKEDIEMLLDWITPDEPIDPDSLRSDCDEVSNVLASSDIEKVRTALVEALDERARDILICRYLNEDPLDAVELGKKWDITDARVRQIEREGLADLRAYLEGRPTSRAIRERKKEIADAGRLQRAPKRPARSTQVAQRKPRSIERQAVVDGLSLIPAMADAGYVLEDHEAKVLRLRHLERGLEASVATVADRMGLPRKRVRQIEKLALKKLRTSLASKVAPVAIKRAGRTYGSPSL